MGLAIQEWDMIAESESRAPSETMNIGILCYASVGGSGIVATELAKALADRGHGVHGQCGSAVRLNEFHPGPDLPSGQHAQLSIVPRTSSSCCRSRTASCRWAASSSSI